MTDEQRQLVSNNHGLIFSFLRERGLDEEEYYDLAAIGLCRAAMSYKADIAKFSTYAYRCMMCDVYKELKAKKVSKRIPEELIDSYNVRCRTDDGVEETEIIDFIRSNIDVEKDVLWRMSVDECLGRLRDRERLIFQLLIEGYSYREIARVIGRSHRTVSKIKLEIVRKLIGIKE